MLVVGWWLLPITLFHFVPLSFSALSWRELLPLSSRPDVVSIIWIRWIRESINALLPVFGVGGDLASARLAHLRGVPGAQAAASMVVDITVGVVTQLIFVMTGVALLVTRSTDHAALLAAWAVLIGIGMFFVAVAAFVLVQHRSMFVMFAKLARRRMRLRNGCPASRAAHRRSTMLLWRHTAAVLPSRAPTSCASSDGLPGAGEIWLVMQVLGPPLGVIDAFILESLGSGVRAAAFMVPGALGALEGGLVLFGALFGLPRRQRWPFPCQNEFAS